MTEKNGMWLTAYAVLFGSACLSTVATGGEPDRSELLNYCQKIVQSDGAVSFFLKGADRRLQDNSGARFVLLYVTDGNSNPWSISCHFADGYPLVVTSLAYAPDFCDCAVSFATPQELTKLNALASR